MTIAELFVVIGLKGDDKTKKGLKETESGLGKVKSMSLEAKAAILGAVYALEKYMSSSSQTGTALMNFNNLTGLSAQKLQEWQYAARQVGVANEEMDGSIKAVQNSMTNMLLGKGAPEGMAMLANKVGFDPEKARDTFYVLEQLQKFAKEVPNDVGNAMIKSFGVSDNVIAAMRRNAFNPETMAKAPKYSDGEINQLNKVDVAWSNLGNKFKMAIGHLTAKDGLKIVNDMSKLADQVLKVADAFVRLADKLKLVEGLGKVFEGWGLIFNGISDSVDKLNKKGLTDFAKDVGTNAMSDLSAIKNYAVQSITGDMPVTPPKSETNNVNINQNLNFQHSGKDAKKTGDSVKKAVQESYRQMQAQRQGS